MDSTRTVARVAWRGAVVLGSLVCSFVSGCDAPPAPRDACPGGACSEALAAREPRASASREVIASPRDAASFLFDERVIRTYELTIAPEDLAKIDAHPSAEEKVAATLRFEGRTISDVTARYKGSVGSFLYPCTDETRLGVEPGAKTGKCALKLSFDGKDDTGRFYGVRKLNLHSMGRDASFMRESLGYGLFRKLGVAAPRTAYARLVVNGQLEGLFLVVEQIDDVFVQSRFTDGGKGNLYKEVWPMYTKPEPYIDALETGKKGADVSKMVNFAQAIKADPTAAARWLDRDYTLAYLAVDRLTQNDDGIMHWYCGWPSATNHNYYWYEASGAAERMWLIPWDLDGSMANEPRVHVGVEWSQAASCSCKTFIGVPQRAPSCDPLIKQLGTWKEDYDAKLDRLLAGPYASARLDKEIDRLGAFLYEAVAESAGLRRSPDPAAWEKAVDALRAVVDRSREDRGYKYEPPPAAAPSAPATTPSAPAKPSPAEAAAVDAGAL